MLNILIIEDVESDFLLIERHLKQHGLTVKCQWAANSEELSRHLCHPECLTWDIILSDYSLPDISFRNVLTEVKSILPDVPIILISGSVGEEEAVELLKLGLSDFILKDRIIRLVPSIERSLTDIANKKALRERENKYQTVIETLSDGFMMVDTHGDILDVNDTYATLSGYSRDELLGMNLNVLEAMETQEELCNHIEKVVRIGRDLFETRHRAKNGKVWPAEVSAAYIEINNGLFFIFVRDITKRKADEEQLALAAKVIEQSNEGFLITDAEGKIVMVNHACTEITQFNNSEILGQNPRMFASGRHDADFYRDLWTKLIITGHWIGEIWNRRKDGEIYPAFLSISTVRDHTKNITHFVAVFSDISQRKASEAQLEFLAYHDPLTELPNRLMLFHRLEHSIDVVKREHTQMALLMLDLDRFKDVNDSFGHLAGDNLLQQVAKRLRSLLREVDTIARLGGDEFAILLEDISELEDAARVAEVIISNFSEPWQLPQVAQVRIGVSIGISLHPQHGETPELLLQQADAALYLAKSEGRNRYAYFSEDLTQVARERMELEARLSDAVDRNELKIYFQPQVDINSDLIVGAEALIRWQDPKEGLIAPIRFISVAETTGLIVSIGNWVLQETCRIGKRWIDAGLPPIKLSVNISPLQFRQKNIISMLESVLAETDFPPEWLVLEMTELGLMENQDKVVELFNKLRTLGIRLAIDDFGTGYSSLAYLKRFPLDIVKIDRSFIGDPVDHKNEMEIASTIITMGHTLGFKVLAEGVETAEQLAFLKEKGCDLYQGYFKSLPVTDTELAELLREQKNA